ncbi:Uncharacterised protein [uncultured archaeon]|nr:Uncharacterised protein [uncultured archaeon]
MANKITNQDIALQICANTTANLTSENQDLKEQIPEYQAGFVGKDISVGQGGSFQADSGKFTLAVTYSSNGMLGNYYVRFRLNGVEYTKNLGETVTFTYTDGLNYTLNVRGTGNPAAFYVYKN